MRDAPWRSPRPGKARPRKSSYPPTQRATHVVPEDDGVARLLGMYPTSRPIGTLKSAGRHWVRASAAAEPNFRVGDRLAAVKG
jgi:hypothetical protein